MQLHLKTFRTPDELSNLFRDGTENIKTLYSPCFLLDVVRDFVMQALSDAVEINQVHNRDPIGGSNENLFL